MTSLPSKGFIHYKRMNESIIDVLQTHSCLNWHFRGSIQCLTAFNGLLHLYHSSHSYCSKRCKKCRNAHIHGDILLKKQNKNEEVEQLVAWCNNHNLALNTKKTKEIIEDIHKTGQLSHFSLGMRRWRGSQISSSWVWLQQRICCGAKTSPQQ